MPSATLRLVRPLIRAASAVAPRAIGHLAFGAFCTPQHGRMAKRGAPDAGLSINARLASAREVSVPFPCGTVVAYVFEPEHASTGAVLLIHGWTGRAAFMTAFVAPLLAAGRRVVAFDLPAHGASTGVELNVPIGVDALAAVARVFGPVEAVIAHSFGGSIALAALAGTLPGRPRLVAERLVLIASPASLKQVARRFGGAFGLGPRGQAAMERRIHVVAGRPVETFEGVEQLREARLPTLVIHCEDDKEVGFDDARALALAGPQVALAPLSGVGHRRILHAKSAVALAADFALGLRPSPSARAEPPR